MELRVTTNEDTDDRKWWTSEFLADLASQLAKSADQLSDIADRMQSAKIDKIRVIAETAFTNHAQSVIKGITNAETALVAHLQFKKYKTKPAWQRNRRTVLQNKAKTKAVVIAESLNLVGAGTGKSLTLRQLTKLLLLAQTESFRNDVALILEEIKESGIIEETPTQLAEENKQKLQASAKSVKKRPKK